MSPFRNFDRLTAAVGLALAASLVLAPDLTAQDNPEAMRSSPYTRAPFDMPQIAERVHICSSQACCRRPLAARSRRLVFACSSGL